MTEVINMKNDNNKKEYIDPNIDIFIFETEENITASGDYTGIDFENLI